MAIKNRTYTYANGYTAHHQDSKCIHCGKNITRRTDAHQIGWHHKGGNNMIACDDARGNGMADTHATPEA